MRSQQQHNNFKMLCCGLNWGKVGHCVPPYFEQTNSVNINKKITQAIPDVNYTTCTSKFLANVISPVRLSSVCSPRSHSLSI